MSDPSATPSQPSSGDVTFASGEPVPMGVTDASPAGANTGPSTAPAAAGGAERPSALDSSREAATETSAETSKAPSRTVDRVLGGIRLGVGAALVVAPRWAARVWVGPGADGPGSLVLARAIGARDVALGLQILKGAQQGEPVRHWVTAGFWANRRA